VQPVGLASPGRGDNGVTQKPQQLGHGDRDQPGVQVGALLGELVVFLRAGIRLRTIADETSVFAVILILPAVCHSSSAATDRSAP
jgi:hypothetical protein